MLCAGVKNGSLNQHQLCSKHWGIERKCTAMIHSAFIFKKKKKKRQQHLRRRLLSKASSSQSTGIKVWISLLSATLDPIPTQQHQFFFFKFFLRRHMSSLLKSISVLSWCLDQQCLPSVSRGTTCRAVWRFACCYASSGLFDGFRCDAFPKNKQTKNSSCCAAGWC